MRGEGMLGLLAWVTLALGALGIIAMIVTGRVGEAIVGGIGVGVQFYILISLSAALSDLGKAKVDVTCLKHQVNTLSKEMRELRKKLDSK